MMRVSNLRSSLRSSAVCESAFTRLHLEDRRDDDQPERDDRHPLELSELVGLVDLLGGGFDDLLLQLFLAP